MAKRKTIYMRPWWLAFLIGQRFAFESPYPLEQCVEILEKKSRRGKTKVYENDRHALSIQVHKIDDVSFRYSIRRSAFGGVTGRLSKVGDKTIVHGRGSSKVWWLFVPYMYLLYIGVAFYRQDGGFVGFIFFALLPLVMLLVAWLEQHRYIGLPYELLYFPYAEYKRV